MLTRLSIGNKRRAKESLTHVCKNFIARCHSSQSSVNLVNKFLKYFENSVAMIVMLKNIQFLFIIKDNLSASRFCQLVCYS